MGECEGVMSRGVCAIRDDCDIVERGYTQEDKSWVIDQGRRVFWLLKSRGEAWETQMNSAIQYRDDRILWVRKKQHTVLLVHDDELVSINYC